MKRMKKILIFFSIAFVAAFGISSKCYADFFVVDGQIWQCFDLEIIYLRGSGQTVYDSAEYYALKKAASKITDEYRLSAYVKDLRYPAVEVSSVGHLIGAYISAGKAFEFGDSVKSGVNMLRNRLIDRHAECPEMHFALVGYSQGAMVASQSADAIDPKFMEFIMLLGDPNAYLPEGEGWFPSACFGGELSSWRTFVPNCRTYEGVFGGRKPYEIGSLSGKYSLWCNRNDYICGSSRNPFNNSGHTIYASSGEISWGISYLAKLYLRKKVAEESIPEFEPLRSIKTVAAPEFDNREIVDDGIGADFAAPKNVAAWRDGEELKIRIDEKADGAEYLLVRLNGVDLAYIDAESGTWTINDIASFDDLKLDLLWMNGDGELGEKYTTLSDSLPDSEPPPYSESPTVEVIEETAANEFVNAEGEPPKENNVKGNDDIVSELPSSAEDYSDDDAPTIRDEVKDSNPEYARVAVGLIVACGLLVAFAFRHRKII